MPITSSISGSGVEHAAERLDVRQAAWPGRHPKSRRSRRRESQGQQNALAHGLGLAAVFGQVQETEAARIACVQMLEQLQRLVAAAVVDEQQLGRLAAAAKVLNRRMFSRLASL